MNHGFLSLVWLVGLCTTVQYSMLHLTPAPARVGLCIRVCCISRRHITWAGCPCQMWHMGEGEGGGCVWGGLTVGSHRHSCPPIA